MAASDRAAPRGSRPLFPCGTAMCAACIDKRGILWYNAETTENDMKSENIAAISTPPGRGGVAVIRLSGESPLAAAEKMFTPAGKTEVAAFEPYRMYPGHIGCGGFSDFGLCVYFKAPHSFTGEDVVEFHCHGGTEIARGVLRRALECGCRLAEAGEFTRRAFLNGKLSLSSAEGLADMINGQSEAEVRAGSLLYAERLNAALASVQDTIKNLLAEIDADIDFPDEDIERTDLSDARARIAGAAESLSALAASYGTGKKVKEGVSVVLAGKPNTGKSSLLNALLGSDRAIVSPVAGTTRDVVEGALEIGGVRFCLYDTAGIRDSADTVESLGVGRAKKLIGGADLVLFVADASAPLSAEDREIFSSLEGKRRLIVYNKADISDAGESDPPADIRVSAKTGENIPALRERMFSLCMEGFSADGFLIEERHYAAVRRALAELNEALAVCGKVPPDLLGVHLKAAWDALGEISGETANERIIDEIFSKFCVGK